MSGMTEPIYPDHVTIVGFDGGTQFSVSFVEEEPWTGMQPASVQLTFSWKGYLPGSADPALGVLTDDMQSFLDHCRDWVAAKYGVPMTQEDPRVLLGGTMTATYTPPEVS